jgi:hypothetical protein
VINFDEESDSYGKVIKTVPLPPPGNLGNEPHHCHLNSTKTILGCGGLLSVQLPTGGGRPFRSSQRLNRVITF